MHKVKWRTGVSPSGGHLSGAPISLNLYIVALCPFVFSNMKVLLVGRNWLMAPGS